MPIHAHAQPAVQNQSVASSMSQHTGGAKTESPDKGETSNGSVLPRLQEMANNSPQVKQLMSVQRMVNEGVRVRTIPQSAVVPVVQRQLLPTARHREVVKDAAKRLKNPETDSDNLWIKAIYQELDGIGNPAADECVQKLIEQHVIDMNDWALIQKDYKLYKSSGAKSLDLHERHNTPTVHNEDEASKWVASLIENRIKDLYTTLAGFPGHAMQIQLSINSLVGWYEAKKFSDEAYTRYKDEIIAELNKGKKASPLAIPRYVYTFESGSTTAV
jgi:hypothetical protein